MPRILRIVSALAFALMAALLFNAVIGVFGLGVAIGSVVVAVAAACAAAGFSETRTDGREAP